MLEKDVEKRLRKGIEARGGRCYKFVSPGNSGVPDRLCMVPIPGGLMFLVECKRPGKALTKLQQTVHGEMLTAGGHVWRPVTTFAEVDRLLATVDMLT